MLNTRKSKRAIFKMAWERVKILSISLSEALRYAWKIAKEAYQTIPLLLERYQQIVNHKYASPDVDLSYVTKARAIVNYITLSTDEQTVYQ